MTQTACEFIEVLDGRLDVPEGLRLNRTAAGFKIWTVNDAGHGRGVLIPFDSTLLHAQTMLAMLLRMIERAEKANPSSAADLSS